MKFVKTISDIAVVGGGNTAYNPYQSRMTKAFDFTGAFAMSAILVVMALVILVIRNILEYRGRRNDL